MIQVIDLVDVWMEAGVSRGLAERLSVAAGRQPRAVLEQLAEIGDAIGRGFGSAAELLGVDGMAIVGERVRDGFAEVADVLAAEVPRSPAGATEGRSSGPVEWILCEALCVSRPVAEA